MRLRRRNDNGVYFIDGVVDGRRVRESVGTDRRIAEQMLARRITEVAESRYQLPTQRRFIYEEAVAVFMDWAKANRKTWRSHKSLLRSMQIDFGGMELMRISPFHIERMKVRLLAKGLDKPTVNRYLMALSGLYRRMDELNRYSGKNPVKKVSKYKENPPRTRYLLPEEIARLLPVCKDDLRDIVVTALGTGCRRGELLALRWKDVHLDDEAPRIHVAISKNGKSRDVPLCRTVFETLDALRRKGKPQPDDLVFGRKSGKNAAPWFDHAWQKAIKAVGLEGVRIHDMRHTFASHLVMNGEPLAAVQDLLGHSTPVLTRRYAHLDANVMRKAVAVMDGVLDSAARHEKGTNEDSGSGEANIQELKKTPECA